MIALLREFNVWLIDYYAASTALLLLLGITRASLRQPVQRMALAWATLISLAVLLVLSATPNWPRISLRTKIERARNDIIPAPNFGNLARRSGGAIPFVADAASVGADVGRKGPATEPPTPSTSPSPQVKSFGWLPWDTWLAAVFLAGAIAVVAWEVLGMIQVRRLRSSGLPAPEFASRELETLVPDNTRRPRLLISPHINAAVALGIWRPTILLPAHALEITERPRLRSLLAHESAHVQRGDLWLLGWARLLLITQYAQPLFWWWRRQIRSDQELLADAAAAEVCGRQTYAENLVVWARLQTQSPLAGVVGIWESAGQLTRRIAMLLDERKRVYTQAPGHWYWGTGLTTLVLIITLSFFTLRPGPPAVAAEPPPERKIQPDPVKALPTKTVAGSKAVTSKTLISISGTCRDERQQPLKDVQLRVLFLNHGDGRQEILQEINSDHLGRYDFKVIDFDALSAKSPKPPAYPLERGLVLLAQHPGKGTVIRVISPLVKLEPGEIDLVLRDASSVTGRVVNSDGRPVAGASVLIDLPLVKEITGLRCSVTDADGRYQIADLAQWSQKSDDEDARRQDGSKPSGGVESQRPFTGFGVVRHPDYADHRFKLEAYPATSDFQLPNPATLTGRVTNQMTGQTMSDATIELSLKSLGPGYAPQMTTTGADGRYSFSKKLVPGAYEVKARLQGWPLKGSDIELASGQNTADLQLEAGAIIQGRVIEMATDKPIVTSPPETFALIMARRDGAENFAEYVAIEPDGTFTIAMQSGKTHLSVMGLRVREGLTTHEMRKLLVDNNRQLALTVDVAKGETKKVDLRLFRSTNFESDGIDDFEPPFTPFEDDEDPDPVQAPKKVNVTDSQISTAATIEGLGGSVKIENIDGVNSVVDVDMAHEKLNGKTVSNKQLTDAALQHLHKFPHLKSLELKEGQISDTGLALIRDMPNLQSVCLISAWGLSDVGIGHVATLPKLNRFCTHGAEQLTDESLRHLGQAKTLQHLIMEGGRFSDRGLKHLGDVKHLKELVLSSFESLITDQGLEALAQHTELETLHLEKTQITDAGLKHLHGLKNLTKLDISKSKVTPEGLAALRKVLPKLKAQLQRNEDGAKHSMKHD